MELVKSLKKYKGGIMKKLGNAGMSLMEIMIVLVIMGMMIGFIGPRIMGQLDKAKIQTTKTQMHAVKTALEQYYADNSEYPTGDQGLMALLTNPGDLPNYTPGGYLAGKKLPKDAWGKDFLYESDGVSYTMISYGKDKKLGGKDFAKDILISSE